MQSFGSAKALSPRQRYYSGRGPRGSVGFRVLLIYATPWFPGKYRPPSAAARGTPPRGLAAYASPANPGIRTNYRSTYDPHGARAERDFPIRCWAFEREGPSHPVGVCVEQQTSGGRADARGARNEVLTSRLPYASAGSWATSAQGPDEVVSLAPGYGRVAIVIATSQHKPSLWSERTLAVKRDPCPITATGLAALHHQATEVFWSHCLLQIELTPQCVTRGPGGGCGGT